MMKNKKFLSLKLNAGTGMALGVFIGAAVALLVHLTTGDSTIWSWAIPVGLACGLAIGQGQQHANSGKENQ
ncbi:MAG: hypothetical protein WAS33_00230 [Candidatus Promineifilaceae bacterium]